MASMTDYLETELLTHVVGEGAVFPQPANLYVALFTASPTDTGSTTNEVADASAYARTGPIVWNSEAAGVVTNNGDITFPTATGSWGTVTHVGITDSNTHAAVNMLFHGALTASKTIGNGDTFKIADTDLSITFD